MNKTNRKHTLRNCTVLSGIIMLFLAFTVSTGISQSDNSAGKSSELFDDIPAYQGSVGPGSALYGLKITFENLGESFTFNSSAKLEKQLDHARLRIAEAKAELEKKKIEEANKALERFREKIEVLNESIAGLPQNDTAIIEAQKRIVKHQFVLERLLEDNPDITGLLTAFNTTQRIEDRFEDRTEIRIERKIENGRLVIKEERRIRIRDREREPERNEDIRVQAKIIGNNTEVRVKIEFVSDNTGRNAIASEILNKLRLSREAINNSLEIQPGEREELVERLRAEARIVGEREDRRGDGNDGNEAEAGDDRGGRSGRDGGGDDRSGRNGGGGRGGGVGGIMGSRVEAEFRFPLLNIVNRTEIVELTFQKLNGLTLDRILAVLEIQGEIRQNIEEKTEVKAEIFGNDTEVNVEVKFASSNTEKNAIAQEILNKLKLSRENIAGLLRIEAAMDNRNIEGIDDRNFVAHLSGSDEVPPVNTSAQGEAVFNLREDNNELRFKVTVANIENATASHIHVAQAGQNGPVVAFLFPGPKKVGRFDGVLAEGSINATNLIGPLAGQPLSALITSMRTGGTYANVHTDQHPAGEIRGQIMSAQAVVFKERLEAEARIVGGTTEVEAKFRFTLLNTTDRNGIIEGTFQKLSGLTLDRVVAALEIKVQEQKEVKKEEKREIEPDQERGGRSGRNGGGGKD